MTESITLFRAGEGRYHTYRIPALLTLPLGRVLAFCEGRLGSMEDYGKIDIVLKTSDDGGKSFGGARAIASCGNDTIGNPCPVFDRFTNRIWLFLNTNLAEGDESKINRGEAPRAVGYIYSDDMGETWSDFADMTKTLKKDGWSWYATGPCHAIQLENGRLVIPCNHGVFDKVTHTTPYYVSHVIISDDHGKTWRIGGGLRVQHGNETTIAQLPSGEIYLNARNMEDSFRVTAISRDGGETWEDERIDTNLPDPICQGAVIYTDKGLLFSNNPHIYEENGAGRRDLTVKLSADYGKTWTRSLQICDTYSAYSDMTILKDGRVGIIYECGKAHRYNQIDFRIFSVNEVLQ